MRLWACVCAVLVVSVESQLQHTQATTKPRLGLVSDVLGVDPVPGGPNFNTRPSTGRQCVCLPINQQCPTDHLPSIGTLIGGGNGGNSGGGGNGGNFGAGIINTRIVNTVKAGACPNQKICCINHGGGPVGPGTATPRPPPVRPNPVPIGDTRCGIQNPLPIPHQSPQFAQADFGEYPWVAVVLDLSNNYKGGGALIAPNWILTAAHRVKGERNLKVRLGDLDVSAPQEHPTLKHLEVNVARVIIHPNFDDQTLRHDVALLQLTQSINTGQFPHIGTVCLPEQGQLFAGHSQCWVTGWGKDAFNSTGNFQNNLKEVDLPIVDPTVCQERLRRTRLGDDFILDSKSFVCAGGFKGKDACTGDGGAPLVCPNQSGQFTVVGLVAWGIGCATNEVPGVYVNVPNFVDFIYRYIRS